MLKETTEDKGSVCVCVHKQEKRMRVRKVEGKKEKNGKNLQKGTPKNGKN